MADFLITCMIFKGFFNIRVYGQNLRPGFKARKIRPCSIQKKDHRIHGDRSCIFQNLER